MYNLVRDGVLQQAVAMKQKLTCTDYLTSSLLIFNALKMFKVFYLMTQHTCNFIFHKIQPHFPVKSILTRPPGNIWIIVISEVLFN